MVRVVILPHRSMLSRHDPSPHSRYLHLLFNHSRLTLADLDIVKIRVAYKGMFAIDTIYIDKPKNLSSIMEIRHGSSDHCIILRAFYHKTQRQLLSLRI